MITQAELKEQLHYDPLTGIFTWMVSNNTKIRVGAVAGGVVLGHGGKHYVSIWTMGRGYRAHRLAHLYMTGKFPHQTDHEDGNGTNNKWSNIKRDVTHLENMRNRRLPVNNTSGFIGVCWDSCTERWFVNISVCEKRKFIGRFTKKEDAIAARKTANVLYGFHKNHGQVRPL